jgi:hypothetical protein
MGDRGTHHGGGPRDLEQAGEELVSAISSGHLKKALSYTRKSLAHPAR